MGESSLNHWYVRVPLPTAYLAAARHALAYRLRDNDWRISDDRHGYKRKRQREEEEQLFHA